jgi:dTDP-4-dehydrorhamnose reductase
VRVLVTGAGGMLGRDVVAACRGRHHRVIALTHADFDVADGRAVDEALASCRPEAVINCAAWTDFDTAEVDERGAMRVNDTGAGLVAAASESIGARIVHVSTADVFDGRKREPYTESDLPAALSAYGRSKQAGETAVEIANPRHLIVRTSWLFGHGGPNLVEAMLRLSGEGPELSALSDQVACPTYTRHLAPALALLAESDVYGVHHVAGGGACSQYEFTQEILDQSGLRTRVMAATSDMVARSAQRPAYSVLGSERPDPIALPDWRLALAEYLSARARRPVPGRFEPAPEPQGVSRR